MATVISIALQKGGTGKSTTAQALASTLGFKGKKVLLIDWDSQCNVSFSCGYPTHTKTVIDILNEECRTQDAIVQLKRHDLIVGSEDLSAVERDDGTDYLKDLIAPIKKEYDYIIIDCPPALGNLIFNAFAASDYIIIPTEPSPYALQGLDSFNDTVKRVREQLNPKLKVLGILLIKYSNRTNLDKNIKEMIDEYAKDMNTSMFETTIRAGVAVKEAQISQRPLIDYAKSSKPNIDYKAFTNEVLKRLGG